MNQTGIDTKQSSDSAQDIGGNVKGKDESKEEKLPGSYQDASGGVFV